VAKKNGTIQPTDGGFAFVVDGKVLHEAASRALCGMWGARAGYYQGVTPRRRKPEIPPDLENFRIVKRRLAAALVGEGYPRFLAESRAGLWGPVYQMGANTFGHQW
jgi:hypothetical protein